MSRESETDAKNHWEDPEYKRANDLNYHAPQRINGETWQEWAERRFEFEYCAECHGDVKDHLPAIVLGNWFAVCKGVSK